MSHVAVGARPAYNIRAMTDRLATLVVRRPFAVIGLFVALCAGAAWIHAQNARYDFSFHTMAPTSTEAYARWIRFVATFGNDNDTYLIGFRDDPLLTNENLERIARITERLEALDITATVTSLTNTLDIRGEGDVLDVVEYVGDIPVSETELAELGRRFADDEILVGNMISEDGKTTAIVGRILPGYSDPEIRTAYFDLVDEILADESAGNVEFHTAGIPFMDANIMRHMLRETRVLIPAVLIVMSVSLWLVFGSLRMIWMPITPIVIAAIVTLGTISGVGLPMSLLTGQGFLTTLIVVIGLSDGVHLMNRYGEDLAAGGPDPDRKEALRSTLRHVGRACLLTSVTTAVGFGALAFSDIPTTREFGIFGAYAIGLAYLGAVVFLPACIVATDKIRFRSPRPPGDDGWMTRGLSAAAEFSIARPRTVLAAGIIVFLASAALSTRVRVDNRFTQGLRYNDPGRVATRFFDTNMGGTYPLEIIVEGDAPDAAKSPEVLAAMERVRVGLEAMPNVAKVYSPVVYIKKMNRALAGGGDESYSIPETGDAVAQNLLLFEMAGGDGEFDRLITYDYSTVRMVAFLHDMPPPEYRKIVDRLREIASENLPPGIRIYESGGEPLFHTVTERLVGTLIRSLYLVMPVAFVIIGVAFRSFRFAVISILPNLLPLTIGLGFLGAADISLRFSTVIAFPVGFGLAIDDTIHFLARYGEERRSGLSCLPAVRRTLVTSGRAMILTTGMLILGYVTMLLSAFLGVVHMGLVIIVILAAALFGDLLVLPATIVLFDRAETTKGKAAGLSDPSEARELAGR
jgi:predicted RND superfamily exporter protein